MSPSQQNPKFEDTGPIYTPDDYDKYNVLKVPGLLVLTNIYAVKYLLFFILPIFAEKMPMLRKFAHEQFNPGLLICSLAAALVLVSMVRRGPKVADWARKLWAYGRQILIASLSLELLLLVTYLLLGWRKLDEFWLLFAYLNIMFIIYLFRSRRVRDVFKEYPEKGSDIE